MVGQSLDIVKAAHALLTLSVVQKRCAYYPYVGPLRDHKQLGRLTHAEVYLLSLESVR